MFVTMDPGWRVWAFALLLLLQVPKAVGIPTVTESQELILARTVLDQLVEKHRVTKNILIKFKSRASGSDGEFTPYWKGTLLAADSGRFRLEQNQGVMVCDGRELRQYVPENAQVIVRAAPANTPSGAVGAALPNWLGAKPLRAERNKEGMRVALEASEAALDSLWVTLNVKKNTLLAVETLDAAGNRIEYRVLSLRFGVALRPKDFTFDAPPGVEVVDMR